MKLIGLFTTLALSACVSLTGERPSIADEDCTNIINNFTALTPQDEVAQRFAEPNAIGVVLYTITTEGTVRALFLSEQAVREMETDVRTKEHGTCSIKNASGFWYFGEYSLPKQEKLPDISVRMP